MLDILAQWGKRVNECMLRFITALKDMEHSHFSMGMGYPARAASVLLGTNDIPTVNSKKVLSLETKRLPS